MICAHGKVGGVCEPNKVVGSFRVTTPDAEGGVI